MLAGVIFDPDGVLIDSEECWSEARRAMVAERGRRWTASATRAMMGMSAPEWSRYLRDELPSTRGGATHDRRLSGQAAPAARDRGGGAGGGSALGAGTGLVVEPQADRARA